VLPHIHKNPSSGWRKTSNFRGQPEDIVDKFGKDYDYDSLTRFLAQE
jgi:hypothetical protein